ncbi:hypothetical protein Pd630_LPD02539 [Rhodococcus opacus PD630]|nr:hypothetical protein Pd630_LPD02539 [Rhodococcus opacus PD630]
MAAPLQGLRDRFVAIPQRERVSGCRGGDPTLIISAPASGSNPT